MNSQYVVIGAGGAWKSSAGGVTANSGRTNPLTGRNTFGCF